MSSELDHLQNELIGMLSRMERIEHWKKQASGLTLPAAHDEWGKYSQVKKEIDQINERLDRMGKWFEDIWEKLEEPEPPGKRLAIVK